MSKDVPKNKLKLLYESVTAIYEHDYSYDKFVKYYYGGSFISKILKDVLDVINAYADDDDEDMWLEEHLDDFRQFFNALLPFDVCLLDEMVHWSNTKIILEEVNVFLNTCCIDINISNIYEYLDSSYFILRTIYILISQLMYYNYNEAVYTKYISPMVTRYLVICNFLMQSKIKLDHDHQSHSDILNFAKFNKNDEPVGLEFYGMLDKYLQLDLSQANKKINNGITNRLKNLRTCLEKKEVYGRDLIPVRGYLTFFDGNFIVSLLSYFLNQTKNFLHDLSLDTVHNNITSRLLNFFNKIPAKTNFILSNDCIAELIAFMDVYFYDWMVKQNKKRFI